jgi:hypothetical protein
MSRKSGALTYPETLGPPRPVAGDLYLYYMDVKGIYDKGGEQVEIRKGKGKD